MKRGLAVLAAALALVAVPLAAADADFSDASGDGGGAPDVVAVEVANDSANRVAFGVGLAGNQLLPADGEITLTFDTDQSADTGSGGWDYYAIVANDGSSVLRRWDGTQWVDAPSTTARAYVFAGYVLYGIDRAELGNTAAFDFAVDAVKFANDEIVARDLAPEAEQFWSYAAVAKTYGLGGTPLVLKPKAPAANAKLAAGFVTLRTDSLEPLVGAKSTCKMTLAGKRILAKLVTGLGYAQCETAAKLPKAAKGKLLKLTITTSAGGKSVTKTFTGKVR